MSYTPTEWESADIVTATRMNKLETAVGDANMSYTPNTWSDGDILTASKMNALEQAVAGGGSSDFSTAEVTIVFDESAGVDSIAGLIAYLYDDILVIDPSIIAQTYTMPISKNGTLIYPEWIVDYINIDGRAEKDEYGAIVVTGDCTLTFWGE